MIQDVLHNMRKLVVYLVVLVALVLASQYGFAWQAEGDLAGISERLAGGSILFVTEDSPLQVLGWMLSPLYALVAKTAGNTDGVIYLFRIVYLVIATFVALVARRMLSDEAGELAATLVSLVFLVFVGLMQPGLTASNLSSLFMAIMLLAGWNSWQCIINDDGSANAGRVIHPLLAGACFFLCLACDPRLLPLLVIICAAGFVLAWRSGLGNPAEGAIWSVCGGAVAAFILLFAFVRCYDPTLLSTGLPSWIGTLDQLPFNWTPVLALLLAAMLAVTVWLPTRIEGTAPAIIGLAIAILLVIAAGCTHMAPVLTDSQRVTLDEGIASGLTVTKQVSEDYAGIESLASTAGRSTAWVCASGSWALTSGTAATSMMSAEWILVPSQELLTRETSSAVAQHANDCISRIEESETFAIMLQTDAGAVYKRASKVATIG